LRRRSTLAAVFFISLIIFGYNLGGPGLAETYIDPVARIPAQDEAVYSSTALHMARSGGWLTPMFLGRYAFYKPPVLYWAVGASVAVFGGSTWALRLPSLLAGATVATILFVWMRDAYSLAAAIAGCLLLLSDRTFHVLARLVLTDMLVTLCIVVAMFCVFRDPELQRRLVTADDAGGVARRH
jgi:4-amino-4-deoxy-L-arabinose transferase-like glycosyltransferase